MAEDCPIRCKIAPVTKSHDKRLRRALPNSGALRGRFSLGAASEAAALPFRTGRAPAPQAGINSQDE
jgi:hypothetical protein